MSKLHFANHSFDEKSSDTLRENENNIQFCLINIYCSGYEIHEYSNKSVRYYVQ